MEVDRAGGVPGFARDFPHRSRAHVHVALVRDGCPGGGAKLPRIDSPEHGTCSAPGGTLAFAAGDPRHRQLGPVHGTQEQSAYNGHFESVCYHPLFVFNPEGDCLAAKLRPGNVHRADGWDEVLLPIIDRYRRWRQGVVVRADAAFATRQSTRRSNDEICDLRFACQRTMSWSGASRIYSSDPGVGPATLRWSGIEASSIRPRRGTDRGG